MLTEKVLLTQYKIWSITFGFSLQVTTEDNEYVDKKEIAIAIRDSTLYCELGCSLLDEEIRFSS